jgi:hypothetical protein
MERSNMAKGVYRDGDSAIVDYGTTARMPVPKKDYVAKGYRPPFDELPTKEQYEAAQKVGK